MKPISSLAFPLFIKWQITQRCNLRCSHCYLTDYTSQSNLESILPFINYFKKKKVAGVVLIGGEPLVRKDLEEIVSALTLQGIPVKITTNGILATPKRAKSLVEAGCKKFQISTEGHNAKLNDPVRGHKTFDKLVKGARALKACGASVSLAFTLSQINAEHIFSFFELAKELEAEKIKLGAFVPIGTGLENQEDFLLDSKTVLEIKKNIKSCREKYPHIQIESAFLENSTGTPSNFTFGCGAGTTSLQLNNDFTVSACDLLAEVERTKTPICSPEELQIIWDSDEIFQRWRGKSKKSKPSLNGLPVINMKGVHQHGCHVAFNSYGMNIFESKDRAN